MQYTAGEIKAHLATLRQTPLLIDSAAEELTEQQLRLRTAPETWSLAEVLAHLHACAEVWSDDIERMLAEDEPRFSKPHPRSVMRASRQLDPPFAESACAFVTSRDRLLRLLESLGPERWERGATINGRRHTISTQMRRMALHEAAHAEQIRETLRAISELKQGG